MEVEELPEFAQFMIKKILGNLDIDAYMDDVGIWCKGLFDEHMIIIDKVLERLARDGMKYNPL